MSTKPSRNYSFWREMKRRHVLRSLAIYAGTAFIILEAVTIIFPRWNLPDWTIDLVLYLLILGAFITFIVAWIFDITPQGIQKTKPIEEVSEIKRSIDSKIWKAATYISLVMIIGLVIFNVLPKTQLKVGDIQSLVVLPFGNFTGDDQLEYFVSGMHASLIGDLGQVSSLEVISKTTADTYKDASLSIPEIASELTVDAVVETQVMCVGDTICLRVRVVTPFPEERQLWAADYREEKSQILNLYTRVTRQITDEVLIELSPYEERLLAVSKEVKPDAYDAYLKGKFHMGFLTPEGIATSLEYFQTAIELDPEYAPAYGGLAGAWIFSKQMKYVTSDEANPKLEEYLTKAIQLDSTNAEVYYYDAMKKMSKDFDWKGAERSFKLCLQINPNFSEAWAFYSHLLMCLKRPDEMRETMNRALEIDPNNYLIQALASVELMVESKTDLAIESALQLQRIMPNNRLVTNVLFNCYVAKGEFDFAIIELKKLLFRDADETVVKKLEEVYKNAGFKEALNATADFWVEREIKPDAGNVLALYRIAGNTEKTLDWLEISYIRGDPDNQYLGLIPFSRSVMDDPRYIDIMHSLNLPIGEFK